MRTGLLASAGVHDLRDREQLDEHDNSDVQRLRRKACAQAALNADIANAGEFRAWLSDDTHSPASWNPKPQGPLSSRIRPSSPTPGPDSSTACSWRRSMSSRQARISSTNRFMRGRAQSPTDPQQPKQVAPLADGPRRILAACQRRPKALLSLVRPWIGASQATTSSTPMPRNTASWAMTSGRFRAALVLSFASDFGAKVVNAEAIRAASVGGTRGTDRLRSLAHCERFIAVEAVFAFILVHCAGLILGEGGRAVSGRAVAEEPGRAAALAAGLPSSAQARHSWSS